MLKKLNKLMIIGLILFVIGIILPIIGVFALKFVGKAAVTLGTIFLILGWIIFIIGIALTLVGIKALNKQDTVESNIYK